MLTLLLGPGGPLRRLTAEVVPAGVGLLVGWTAGALAGVPVGWAVGVGVGLGLSALLRWARRRPLLRRVYRLALVAHALVWGFLGWTGSAPEAAGPVGAAAVVRWERPQRFEAGAGEAPFHLPPHVPLGGWGQRPRRVTLPPCAGCGAVGRLVVDVMRRRADDGTTLAPLFREPEAGGPTLGARALVLRPTEGGPTLAFVRLDLLTSDAWIAEEVTRRTADLGITPATLLVSATHTHSSPGGYARDRFTQLFATDHYDPAVFASIVEAAVASLRAAVAAARPARLAFALAHDRGPDGASLLAARRGAAEGGPIDDRVPVLRVDREDGTMLAVLLDYAVHPVAVRKEHPRLDRDVAGAVEDALSARLAGSPTVLFVQAALADVVPTFTGAPSAPEAPRAAAERFAAAVAPAIERAPWFDRLAVAAARVERDFGDPRLLVGLGPRGLLLDDASLAGPFRGAAAGFAADLLALPVNALVWGAGLSEFRTVGTVRGALGVQVNLASYLSRRTHAVGVLRLDALRSDGTASVRVPLLWVPGEPSCELGQAWRRARPEAPVVPFVVALTNGSLGYVVTADEQRTSAYESLATLFGAETDRLLTEALTRARDALGP